MSNNIEETMEFDVLKNREALTKAILSEVYDSLKKKGYNPINQLVGYLISGDPTYITNYNGARALVRKLERDEILEEVIKSYLEVE
ncbi:MAG: IreB family regulatory phosphoprotein [Clostridiales bacterium]|nr:IreB family regulatory phosphoprotein [Clostridiales bacterium]